MRWPWQRREDDLRQEIQTHLDLAAADRVGRGEAEADARAAATREFGNVALVQEVTRGMWGWRVLGVLAQDLRFGWRILRRSPVTTLVAVASLAIGIGANTAIFSVADTVMLRSLPVPAPDRLYSLQGALPRTMTAGDTWIDAIFTYPDLATMRAGTASVATLAAVAEIDRSNLRVGTETASGVVHVAMVSGTYFDVMGLTPALGRLLGPSDDLEPGAHPVAIVSDRYWRRQLHAQSDIVGRTFSLNDVAYTVVGVAPPRFEGDWLGQPMDLWVPIAMQSQVQPERPGLLTNQNAPWIRLVGRLRAGVPVATAQAAVDTTFQANRGPIQPDPRVTAAELQDERDRRLVMRPLGRGYAPERQLVTPILLLIASVAGLVLLLACSNVASLLLARATAREREMAVRLAIGASRGRIFRQLLTESLLLSGLGGVAACVVAWWGASLVGDAMGAGVGLTLDVHPDARLFAFAALLALVTGILFGLTPARSAWRTRLVDAMGGRGSDQTPHRFRTLRGLVIVQVALSIVLTLGALLFAQSLRNLRQQGLDHNRGRVLAAWVPASQTGRRGAAIASLFEAARERLPRVPGIAEVSASSSDFFGVGGGGQSPITVPGHTRTDDEGFFVRWNLVTPGFFSTVGIPLLSGRDFAPGDREGTARVAIINASMAKHYFGDVTAVGKRFGIRRDTGSEIEIIGVVADAAIDSPRNVRDRMIYLPYRQDLSHLYDMAIFVRTSRDPAAVVSGVRAALHEIDPGLPIASLTTLDAQLDQSLAEERFVTGLSGVFGVMAIGLTCIGLFGVLSYMTARRTAEIGVRFALGASRGAMVAMTLRDALIVTLLGLLAGVPAAIGAGRLLGKQLFGVTATDPVALTIAAVGTLTVALAAAALPALRATRVDPAVALRLE